MKEIRKNFLYISKVWSCLESDDCIAAGKDMYGHLFIPWPVPLFLL
jgi:hypothetical protein